MAHLRQSQRIWPYSITASFLFAAVSILIFAGAGESGQSSKILTEDTFIEVAKKVQPAVVSITVSGINEERMQRFQQFHGGDGNNDDAMERFREMFPDGLPFPFSIPDDEMDEDMFRFRTAGSGVIVRSDGYIVTNNHVIGANAGGDYKANEGRIVVTLKDGRKFESDQVKIQGIDPLTDLAVLKVNADDLPTATWGSSDETEVGQWVLAIGDPLEFRNSVTQGIISAVGRELSVSTFIQKYIQTTAVINPGNSGGALVNLDGEVIGINQAITTRTGLWAGIGFAIPSALAQDVTDQIISKEQVTRGYVGIQMHPLNENIKEHFEFEGDGILVNEVVAGEPAAEAGIEGNDIIVEIDGTEVSDTLDMLRIVSSKNVGDKVKFRVYRDGDYKNINVTVGERPTERELMAGLRRGGDSDTDSPDGGKGALGMRGKGEKAEPAPLANRDYFVVESIQPQSAWYRAGIRPGDEIYEVNGMPVQSSDDILEALDKKDDTALVKFFRGDRRQLVVVEFDE